MLEKLLLYDNQQPRPLIMLRNILMVRLIDYPKGVLAVMLGNGDKLFIKLFGITIHKYIYNEIKIYIVMIINIYGLVYPSTQEVIYVGQTRTSIEHRSAYSNVHKVLTGKLIYKPYGYNWKYIE